ncbi:type I restriction endonuclease subunit R [Kitasatospora sp. NPDC057692]|uniref:type I restriction endonuclease subunit R n=1 Tax=Kitasatospora sp. NPDC057692 TaxID=3346215 RepID=UPI00367A9B1E
MTGPLTEAEWVRLGWEVVEGSRLAPGSGHRRSWDDLVLHDRLRDAVVRLNPGLPATAVSEALSAAADPVSHDLYAENRRGHGQLTRGVPVVHVDEFGARHTLLVRLVDPADADANRYVVATGVVLAGADGRRCRLDAVLYVNGLPVAVIEVKESRKAGMLQGAHRQVRCYTEAFPGAFRHTAVTLLASAADALYGMPLTPFEHYAPWNVDEAGRSVRQDGTDRPAGERVLLAVRGLFDRTRLLRLVEGFVGFSAEATYIARPHQYFAATKAARRVVEAFRTDGRAGVVHHAAGAGGSWTMALTCGLVFREPVLNRPTVVVVTDRADRARQLFETFRERGTVPEPLHHAFSREDLRELLAGGQSGVVFTTLQKFGPTPGEQKSGGGHPMLSDRRNVVVIVDEAHRWTRSSHLHRALPNATLLAFTSAPPSADDRAIRRLYGAGIDVYDFERATADGMTLPVFYENRTVELDHDSSSDLPEIDEESDRLPRPGGRRLQRTVATLNSAHGSPARVRTLAADLAAHWEQRRAHMAPFIGAPGKALIVCASRELCVRVFDALREERPDWAHPAVDRGRMKVVVSDSGTDPDGLRAHALTPSERSIVEMRARTADDDLELLIVHSMLLSGFDAPPVHTMYLDRPLRGTLLMQALARVNRPFRGKPAGLLVGYVPLADGIRRTLAEFSPGGRITGTDDPKIFAVLDELRAEYDTVCELLSGVDWRTMLAAPGPDAYRGAVWRTLDHLRAPRTPGNGGAAEPRLLGRRFLEHTHRLQWLYAMAFAGDGVSERFPEFPDWRSDIAFLTEVRAGMAELEPEDPRSAPPVGFGELEERLAQLASPGGAGAGEPAAAEAGAGAAIAGLRASDTPHLVADTLRRVAERSVREVTEHNTVRRAALSARLRDLTAGYERREITSDEVIAELTDLAREAAGDGARRDHFSPPLSEDELAFFDALAGHGPARVELGDEALARIAREMVVTVRQRLTIDWLSHEPARARLRSTVRRLLARHGYPPAGVPEAVALVIGQLEYFAREWEAKRTEA